MGDIELIAYRPAPGEADVRQGAGRANVCDTNYTSIAKMPERYLPGAAYDGAHARLREPAATLG